MGGSRQSKSTASTRSQNCIRLRHDCGIHFGPQYLQFVPPSRASILRATRCSRWYLTAMLMTPQITTVRTTPIRIRTACARRNHHTITGSREVSSIEGVPHFIQQRSSKFIPLAIFTISRSPADSCLLLMAHSTFDRRCVGIVLVRGERCTNRSAGGLLCQRPRE